MNNCRPRCENSILLGCLIGYDVREDSIIWRKDNSVPLNKNNINYTTCCNWTDLNNFVALIFVL